MTGKKLAEEAEEFKKEKTPKLSQSDKTAMRFYFGNALCGVLADHTLRQRPTEALNAAWEWAKMAKQWEDDNT